MFFFGKNAVTASRNSIFSRLNYLSQPHQNLGDELWGIFLSAHQILAKSVNRNGRYGFSKSRPIFPKKGLVLVKIVL